MKKFIIQLTAVTTLLASSLVFAASPVGTWKTIDDDTGEVKSEVEIYMNGDTLEGKVSKILTNKKASTCEKCEGDLKGKPVLGMVFMSGFKDTGKKGTWKGGTILDPEKGKVYKSKVMLSEDNKTLKVRGYIGPFFRTQEWKRVK